jgi:GMP synthase (glutamine-hydrolysing)
MLCSLLVNAVDSITLAELAPICTLQEGERVMELFTEHLHLPVTMVDQSKSMLANLAGVTDPEKKRKIIGAEFIEVFKDFANNMERDLGHKPKFLVQVRNGG